MAENKTKSPPHSAKSHASARQAREAAALRANLKRRKMPSSSHSPRVRGECTPPPAKEGES